MDTAYQTEIRPITDLLQRLTIAHGSIRVRSMIPDHARTDLINNLVRLGGTEEQQKRIGDILFTTAAAPVGHDAEYLLEVRDDDPVIQEARGYIVDAICS